MKRGRLFVVLGFAFALANLRPLAAQDVSAVMGLPTQFSVNVSATDAKGVTFTERLYRDNDKVRVDVDHGNARVIEIYRGDEKKVYTMGLVMSVAIVKAYTPSTTPTPSTYPEGVCKALGTEDVDGVTCAKFQVTSAKTGKGFLWWIDLARKVPVKMIYQDQTKRVIYDDFAAGPQDPSLFEVPEGFREVEMNPGK